MSLITMKFLNKIAVVRSQGRLGSAIYSRVRPYVEGAKYLFYNPAAKSIILHRPSYCMPDKNERKLAERIFTSFRKMKRDQKLAAQLYQPSSLWEAQLKKSYAYLISGLEENNIDKFHFFLANFGAWKEYTGVEEGSLIQKYAKPGFLITRRYLQNEIFYNLLKLWKYYNVDKEVDCLERPNYGNLSGAYIDGVLLTVDSFFGEIYGSLLSGLLQPLQRPVIGEIGAGCGRLAYYTIRRQESFAYIDFDLPEVLCLASYYLMKTFPQKKTLLYGEEEYTPATHLKYDLIFMPSYEICKLDSSCVHLFINETSLGEMTQEAAENYLHYITKSTKYFFHLNHDRTPNIYDDKTHGLLGHEYPVPQDKFVLLFRYPDLKHMLFHGGQVDLKNDIFVYMYERIAS